MVSLVGGAENRSSADLVGEDDAPGLQISELVHTTYETNFHDGVQSYGQKLRFIHFLLNMQDTIYSRPINILSRELRCFGFVLKPTHKNCG